MAESSVGETEEPIVVTERGGPVSDEVVVEPGQGTISGLFPEFSGLWNDPAETVIDPLDADLPDADPAGV